MKQIICRVSFVAIFMAATFLGCSSRSVFRSEIAGFVDLDTVHAGAFDTGKMWTFDFPPTDYFSRTYGFTPTKDWFDKARLSALRLPNCTASFISEDGLVMTNHHCARSALDSVNREGEKLPETGFYAVTLEEERKAPGTFIDQLVVIEDVTSEVQQAFNSGATDNEKVAKRIEKIQEIQKRFADQYKTKAPNDSMEFKVYSFYNGGRFSLYGYKRYTDVRLVYAPEDEIAFFGGDPDNFTYPRYDFDCAFFRVYEGGKPLRTSNFLRLSDEGIKDGDAVFVIGNPGSTRRLYTIAQLEFLRDYQYPTLIESYEKTANIYADYIQAHPESKVKYMNIVYGQQNSRKALTGYLDGLRDPFLMAKKKDFENKFKEKVSGNSELSSKIGDPWKDIAHFEKDLAVIYPDLDAMRFRGRYFSKYLLLTFNLVDYAFNKGEPMSDSARAKFYPSDINPEIEKNLLADRLSFMKGKFGNRNEPLNKLLAGRTPDDAAKDLAANSLIASKEKTEALLTGPPGDILKLSDPLVQFFAANWEFIKDLQRSYDRIYKKIQSRTQMLGNALYQIYGTSIPPDATFSLRISDGIVKGYEYNGTIAPPVTTFYGMYDRYYSFGKNDPWNLPDRWANPPASFKLSTPLNFVSTNDIIGGNSGSPAVTKDLQIVGLIFDGNIESLPGDIIFDETKNRSVSVNSAGILEGLEQIYKANRLAKEIRNGKIVP